MPFNGMEDRLNSYFSKLYSVGSTRDVGDGTKNDQPFLEFKPNDPNRTETENDNFLFPIGSVNRDVQRIGKFLKSGEGLLFLAESELLQTGNSYGETRILNPAFILGNVVPFLHLDRSLTNSTDIPLSGDTTQKSSISDANLGSAGRLQVATSNQSIATATGKSNSGLLSLLSDTSITQLLSDITGLGSVGILGVNQRPEFDVDGEMFSVKLWEGFRKSAPIVNNINNLVTNLQSGNIPASINDISSGFTSIANDSFGNVLQIDGRDSPSPWEDGKRYFIKDKNTYDGYLVNAINFTTNPDGTLSAESHVPYLNPQPFVLGPIPVSNTSNTFQSSFGISSLLDNSQQSVSFFSNTVASNIRQAINTSNVPSYVNQLPNIIPSIADGASNSPDNPAENNMLFPDLSLRQRYLNNNVVSFIRTQLDAQKTTQTQYWQTHQSKTGLVGGIIPGQDITVNYKTRLPAGNYLHDKLNDYPITTGTGNLQTSDQTIQNIYNNYGQDLVNVMFFDFVNKRTIPFRAFIDNIEESVTPDVKDTRYIGRIERNVVYTGVIRTLSFNLYIQAFDDTELDRIWRKVNYLTGMCFPADYDKGYMVPPLIKLTIGDFYRDQPGYIKTINNIVEKETSWEITPGIQVPHAILSHITYEVIEKFQARSDSIFYPFGIPRSADVQMSQDLDSNSTSPQQVSSTANTNTILGG